MCAREAVLPAGYTYGNVRTYLSTPWRPKRSSGPTKLSRNSRTMPNFAGMTSQSGGASSSSNSGWQSSFDEAAALETASLHSLDSEGSGDPDGKKRN